jgi:hypothetical protein
MISPTCLQCQHCGPQIPREGKPPLIRCDHPQWKELEVSEDDDMRQLLPDFGDICEDFTFKTA